MGKKDDNIHQLHVNIPKNLYEEVLRLLPEKGMVSGLIRRFLRTYINKTKNIEDSVSPVTTATDQIIKEDIERY